MLNSSANSDQLNVLRDVMDSFCKRNCIAGRDRRNQIAAYLFAVFQQGISDPAKLRTILETRMRMARADQEHDEAEG